MLHRLCSEYATVICTVNDPLLDVLRKLHSAPKEARPIISHSLDLMYLLGKNLTPFPYSVVASRSRLFGLHSNPTAFCFEESRRAVGCVGRIWAPQGDDDWCGQRTSLELLLRSRAIQQKTIWHGIDRVGQVSYSVSSRMLTVLLVWQQVRFCISIPESECTKISIDCFTTQSPWVCSGRCSRFGFPSLDPISAFSYGFNECVVVGIERWESRFLHGGWIPAAPAQGFCQSRPETQVSYNG